MNILVVTAGTFAVMFILDILVPRIIARIMLKMGWKDDNSSERN